MSPAIEAAGHGWNRIDREGAGDFCGPGVLTHRPRAGMFQ